ncbi:RNA polymerase B [Rhizina undulata]
MFKTNGQAPRSSREKQGKVEIEEASHELNLGGYTKATCLTISEAALIYNKLCDMRQKEGLPIPDKEDSKKTKKYFDNYARLRGEEVIAGLEHRMNQYHYLTGYEKGQLGNLVCGSAEEAKSLIPSLVGKIDDEDLEELIQDIRRLILTSV